MNFFEEYFKPKYFFISFFVGMFLVYITVPTPEVIIRYPTPHNTEDLVYKDSADMCYMYDSKEVPCTKDSLDTPLQHVNNKIKNTQSVWSKIVPSLGNHT